MSLGVAQLLPPFRFLDLNLAGLVPGHQSLYACGRWLTAMEEARAQGTLAVPPSGPLLLPCREKT